MKVFLTLLLFVTGTNLAEAQILNFEKNRKPGDPELEKTVVGALSLDFSLNNRSLNRDGETDLYIGSNIATNLGYFLKKHAFYSFGDLVYSAVGDQAITSAGFLHLRANFLRNRVLSYEIFGQGQFDEARGLNKRYLAGAGLRFKLVDNDRTIIAAGTGLMFEKEQWNSENKNLLKSTNYISISQKVNERMQVSSIGYYQTGFDSAIDAFRNRISGEFTVKANVFSSFSYTTSFFIYYEDRPILPITKTVFSLTNGFSWNF
ncbi:MAG: DUF481 domain-containing protein [Balneolaceae bacterium]